MKIKQKKRNKNIHIIIYKRFASKDFPVELVIFSLRIAKIFHYKFSTPGFFHEIENNSSVKLNFSNFKQKERQCPSDIPLALCIMGARKNYTPITYFY